jgi:hypothetical protein
MASATPKTVNPDTLTLYNSVPPYIQDWDVDNGYQLLSWLDGAGAMLQPTDNLVRDNYDNGGIGYSLLMNYPYYYNGYLNGVYYTGMLDLNDVNQALAFLPWFAQFVGLSLSIIPSSVFQTAANPNLSSIARVQMFQPYINNWIESIVYTNTFERGTIGHITNSLAAFLTTYSNYGSFMTSIASASISSGVMTYTLVGGAANYSVGDYATVYGFGKTVAGAANFNVSKAQVIAIGSGTFSVQTTQADATSPVASSYPSPYVGLASVSASAFTVLEGTHYVNGQYLPDANAVTILIPKRFFPSNVYNVVFSNSNLYSYYETIGNVPYYATYSSYPNTPFAITNFLSVVIPAGLTYNIVSI